MLNYDCPFNTTDYLHRAGRTGRATELFPGEGEILTYITQNKQVAFARKIQVKVINVCQKICITIEIQKFHF